MIAGCRLDISRYVRIHCTPQCTVQCTAKCTVFPCSEAEFLDVIGTKVLLFTVTQILSPPLPTPSKSGLKLICNVNILYGNLKSEISQHYAQKYGLNYIDTKAKFCHLKKIDLKENTGMYNFVKISGHNLESSQA
jgi:hypothetical protein